MENNNMLDSAVFRLASQLVTDLDFPSLTLTADIYAVNANWTLVDDKLGTILQKFKLKIINGDDSEVFGSMRIKSAVANGTIFGLPRYTVTFALAEDGGNPTMRGLANSDDGINTVDNIMSSRIVATFPADSPCAIFVGGAEYRELTGSFESGTTTYLATYGEALDARVPFMIHPITKKILTYDGTYPLKGVTIEAASLDDVRLVGTWGYLSTGYPAWDSTKKVYADSATGLFTQTPSATTVQVGSPEILMSAGGDFTGLRLALAADATEKASEAEMIAGVDDFKYATPLGTKAAIDANAQKIGHVIMVITDGTGSLSIADRIDLGWAVCDGTTPSAQGVADIIRTEATPNMVDRFIKGNSTESGATGGSETSPLPDHLHSVAIASGVGVYDGAAAVGPASSGGAHTHNVAGDTENPTTTPTISIDPLNFEVVFMIKVR